MSMNVMLDLTHATVMPHAQILMEVMTVNVSKGSQEMASIVQVSFSYLKDYFLYSLFIGEWSIPTLL